MNTETKSFEVGKSYWTRSICDYDCIISMTVLKRTAKFVTVALSGNRTKRLGVSVYSGEEQVSPWGRYSMSPIIGAGKQG